jgi:3-hydroxybutyryl-CoA dehydratase
MTDDVNGPVRAMPVAVGDTVRLQFTLTEAVVDRFAEATGDYDLVHVDADHAKAVGLPGRIAHGVHMVGYMSAAASEMEQLHDISALSYGYDRVRFTKPVVVGSVLDVEYAIDELMPAERKYIARCMVSDEVGDVVAVAKHISKLID